MDEPLSRCYKNRISDGGGGNNMQLNTFPMQSTQFYA